MPSSSLETEDCQPLPDATSAWASACVSALMERHGVAPRHQATVIAQICAISVSQARRKLRGAVWLLNEVLALARHFGEGLDAIFAADASRLTPSQSPAVAPTYPAVLLMDGDRLECDIQLGAILPTSSASPNAPALVAAHLPANGWCVGSPRRMASEGACTALYAVQHLHMRAPQPLSRARIAVLDDDIGSADALADWFNELGYCAQAFTSARQLLASSLHAHDAYVIDLILGGGQTSQALVEQIRLAQPQAPIVLLTGQLRDGTASEATLSTILRTQGVTFFEKPVRPAVLTAAVQSALDRLATAQAQ
ncbi:MAG: helix-turn-helix domain-containing protein [Aquabacterium sp.]